MMRFTASLTNESPSGSVTTSATIELTPGPDTAGRIKALVEQVTAATQPKIAPTNGHSVQPTKAAATVAAQNGNGNGHARHDGGEYGCSAKQKGMILGCASRLGLKLPDVNARARASFGPDAQLNNLTKQEASMLIDALKAEAPAAKGE
jgi:hypothetical protein